LEKALQTCHDAHYKTGLLESVIQENDNLAMLDIKRLEQVGIYTKTLEATGVCPTCMGKVTKQTINNVRKTL